MSKFSSVVKKSSGQNVASFMTMGFKLNHSMFILIHNSLWHSLGLVWFGSATSEATARAASKSHNFGCNMLPRKRQASQNL
eukprot:3373713-Amphidinium_carterae.1